MPHIMLSYQWDSQELVQAVHDRLAELGFNVWMDIEGGMSGNINEAMAEAVEGAQVVCPFLTEKYSKSKNCKKELNYTDSLDKEIVPCMADKFKPSGWLGLITAGMLWMDFRNPANIDNSIESLIKELREVCEDNLPMKSVEDVPRVLRSTASEEVVVEKPSNAGTVRAFKHIRTGKYLAESGDSVTHWGSGTRNHLVIRDTAEDTSFWTQESKGKGTGIVFFRNYHTKCYLGYDPNGDYVYTKSEHYGAEERRLMNDDSDDTGRRAVIIFADYGKKFLTVNDEEGLTGVEEQTEDCRWYLD